MVTLAYLDTSAALKLIVEERESAALARELTAGVERHLVSSWLLHTELHCAAGRRPEIVDAGAMSVVLGAVDLVDLSRGDMIAAGTLAPLRTNDAIHLAVAIRLGVAEIVTYDGELADAALRAGLQATAPA